MTLVSIPLLLAHGGVGVFAALEWLVAAALALPVAALVMAITGFTLKRFASAFAPRNVKQWFQLSIIVWFFCALSFLAIFSRACE